MPHINTQPGQHDHTASAFIIRTDLDEPRLLLHRHKKLNKYIQFGGHIELDETPWQGIQHEILEESGYNMSQLSLLQPAERITSLTGVKLHPVAIYHNTHHFNETHFHTDVGYAFTAKSEPLSSIANNEASEIQLLTRQELIDLPADQTFESVREAALFIFDVCLQKWNIVDMSDFA